MFIVRIDSIPLTTTRLCQLNKLIDWQSEQRILIEAAYKV